ncbi:piezo-type mechanosensitive ion channel component-like [Oppia nitens]|uniref:piezo-type mechanosensitive ion channel component-like n=1 Tax=Oppia nitens TaxID=1686743 RepID=UPI0023DC5FAE|nr:piezo-type mechanosensitive ion channel component-like [Oppia nitens]
MDTTYQSTNYINGQPGLSPDHQNRSINVTDISEHLSSQQSNVHQSSGKSRPLIEWISGIISVVLIKYWIWIVASMLMVMSLSGDRIVLYRIVYMALFLTFVLLFQFSYSLWKRFLYSFWLIVIIYSIITLLAIYSYQFNGVPEFWSDSLKVNNQLQQDLGLQVYKQDIWVLFKELFTPTFFLIITIIQVHYFHHKFLAYINSDKQIGCESPTTTSQTTSPQDLVNDNIQLNLDIDSDGRTDISSTDTQTQNTVKTLLSKSQKSSQSLHRNKVFDQQLSVESSEPKDSNELSLIQNESKTEPQEDCKSSFEEIKELLAVVWVKLEPIVKLCVEVIWRLIEIHIIKVVTFCSVVVAISDVSAMNIVFIILAVLSMPFNHLETIICRLLSIWATVMILLKMLFQLQFAQNIKWETVCSNQQNMTLDNRLWIGLHPTDNIFVYLTEYIILIVVLVLRSVVIIRQYEHRLKHNKCPPTGVVFAGVGRKDADKDLKGLTMFCINYCFYKFGVEVCFILLTISIGSRNDIFSVLYSFWLLLMVLMNRKNVEKIWPYFVGFLVVVLPLQYIICLGLPQGLCIDYPWKNIPGFSDRLRRWLFLPNYNEDPGVGKLYLDFFILMFCCRQLIGFRLEKSLTCLGGSNIEAHLEKNIVSTNMNSVPDFFAFGHTVLDSIKSTFFFCFFWITLAIIFMAGTLQVSLFALGYVLACFLFLWNGNEFYLKPIELVFRLWKTIIAYTALVILSKAILQIVGCVYITSLLKDWCWVVQLLGIACLDPSNSIPTESLPLDGTCKQPSEAAGLLWDAICFAFLIIQKRIFCSYYFTHLVREVKAQQVLASRGAELIHEIQAKEVADQELAEKEVMEKIKQKMDRIKAAQQRMFADKAKSIKAHKQAVRSGGYYMFDDTESEMVDLNEKPRKSLIPDPEGDEMRNFAKLQGFTAFCAKLMKGEVDETEATIVSEESVDIGESSKDSAIVSLDRDPDASMSTAITTVEQLSSSSKPSTHVISSKKSSKYWKQDVKNENEKEVDISDRDENEEKEEEEEKNKKKESIFSKMKNILHLFIMFIESALISMTAKLNTLSRDYRYVARRLSIEKKYLKRILEIEESNGSKYDFMDNIWKKRTLAKISQSTLPKERSFDSVNDVISKKKNKIGESEKPNSDEAIISMESDLEDSSFLRANVYMRFVRSVFYAILSRSEVMCYIIIVFNQITSASILSLPLPLFAFLWGSLSIPRPSKAFWITVITYTEVIVVIKYIFQFDFWPWLRDPRIHFSPFYWPRIFGISKTENYAQYDLALLLVLFFHRFMLKSLGLWDLSEAEITAFMETVERKTSMFLDQMSQTNILAKLKSDKKRKLSVKNQKIIDKCEAKVEKKTEQELDIEKQLLLRERSLSDRERDPSFCVIGFSEVTTIDETQECQSKGFVSPIKFLNLKTIKLRSQKIIKPVRHFMHSVLHPPYRISKDVYSLMFLCDFVNFFILVFGFSAFASGISEDVTSFLEENKIPIPFLVTLLLQFALIIIDRALYLRKYIKGKLVFQILLALGIHIWLFFALPAMTDKPFTTRENWPPKFYYIFKCIYFLLSAYQIRSGYPTRILGNTFCKKYNLINWYLFKGYMVIPFLYDLRMYMDWIWTDTSLVLDEWSLMEDIFVNLYERKCELKLDEEFPEPRGKAKRRFFKYLLGGAWVVLIIGLIWGPLGLFALGSAVGSTNKPVGAKIELEFGGYQPVFQMSVSENGLQPIDDRLFDYLKTNNDFVGNAMAQAFINGYDQSDIMVVHLNGNSTAVWGISPPSAQKLSEDLLNNTIEVTVKLTYSIIRIKKQKTQDMDVIISDSRIRKLHPISDWLLRKNIAEMLKSNITGEQPAVIPNIFPNYLRVPEKGKPTVVDKLIRSKPNPDNETKDLYEYRNVGILLQRAQGSTGDSNLWWEIHDICDYSDNRFLDEFFKEDLLKSQNCQYLPIVLFNDKVFIGLLAFLSGYGIIGIYTTFVFLVSRWVRGLNSEASFKVIYTRMPNVDRVLQLCLDIYLVRESHEFELEEDLYAKLIFLYRSPEMLIKWTKPAEELPSQETQHQKHRHSGHQQ